MLDVMRMMAGLYRFAYKALDTMGGLILLIILGLVALAYFLHAYLIYIAVLAGVLVAGRVALWFRIRRW